VVNGRGLDSGDAQGGDSVLEFLVEMGEDLRAPVAEACSALAIAVRILSRSARRRAAAYGGMSAAAANSDTLSIKNDKVWSVTVAVR
jgi:hypothetical protein